MSILASAVKTGTRPASSAKTAVKSESWKNFGTHLTLDGYQGNRALLDSMEQVFAILDRLPEALGMHKIITPYVIRCAGNDKKDPGGISGFVMIAESHISIHTFPGRRFVSVDVYTCQEDLDSDKATNALKKAFRLGEMEIQIIKRGQRFGELAKLVE